MDTELLQDESPDCLEVTVEMRARHALIWKAVQQFGSILALAEHLGCSSSTVSNWLNLKSTPVATPKGGRRPHIKRERTRRIVLELCRICHCHAKDLFPDWLTMEKLRTLPNRAEYTHKIEPKTLALASVPQSLLVDKTSAVPFEQVAQRLDRRDLIEKALKTLNTREQQVVKMRFGIGFATTYTLEEVGRVLRIRRERVRQIEAKALRKLQREGRREILEPLLDE